MDNVLNYKISVGTILTAGIAVGGAIYYYNANNNNGDKDKKGTDGYRTPPRQKLTIDTNTSDTKRNRMRPIISVVDTPSVLGIERNIPSSFT